jgi:hypothetical protein
LQSIRQVRMSVIQTLRATFRWPLRIWGKLDISIVLLQLLINRVKTAVQKLRKLALSWSVEFVSSYRL